MCLDLDELKEKAHWLREQTVRHSYGIPHHLGGSLSCIEILTALYYGRLDDEGTASALRRRIILSKGHACVPLYVILADLGLIDPLELRRMMAMGGALLGHPCRTTTPGIEASSGSLGQGVSVAVGLGFGLHRRGNDSAVYAVLGDSELQSGQTWEALLLLSQHRLRNVQVIVDFNGLQADGPVCGIVSVDGVCSALAALGLGTEHCDGHDLEILCRLLRRDATARPTVVIAHTVKGKGVSFMENSNAWHSGTLSSDVYEGAIHELSAGVVRSPVRQPAQ